MFVFTAFNVCQIIFFSSLVFPFLFLSCPSHNFKTCCFGEVLFYLCFFILSFSAGLVGSPLLCLGSILLGTLLLYFGGVFTDFVFLKTCREMGLISRKLFPACESMCVCCPALRSSSRQPVKRYKKLLSEIFPKSLVSILFCFVD
jgi:hypothetical protein